DRARPALQRCLGPVAYVVPERGRSAEDDRATASEHHGPRGAVAHRAVADRGGAVRGCRPPSRYREGGRHPRSEEHTSELQSRSDLVCRLLLEKKKKQKKPYETTAHHLDPLH